MDRSATRSQAVSIAPANRSNSCANSGKYSPTPLAMILVADLGDQMPAFLVRKIARNAFSRSTESTSAQAPERSTENVSAIDLPAAVARLPIALARDGLK